MLKSSYTKDYGHNTYCTASSVKPVGPHTHTKHLESSGLSRKACSIVASIRPLLPVHEPTGSERTYSTWNLSKGRIKSFCADANVSMSDVCTAYWFLFAVSKWNMQQVAYYRVINWSEKTLPRFFCTQLLQLRVPQDVSLLTIKENQLGLSEKGETLLKHRKLTVHNSKKTPQKNKHI